MKHVTVIYISDFTLGLYSSTRVVVYTVYWVLLPTREPRSTVMYYGGTVLHLFTAGNLEL